MNASAFNFIFAKASPEALPLGGPRSRRALVKNDKPVISECQRAAVKCSPTRCPAALNLTAGVGLRKQPYDASEVAHVQGANTKSHLSSDDMQPALERSDLGQDSNCLVSCDLVKHARPSKER